MVEEEEEEGLWSESAGLRSVDSPLAMRISIATPVGWLCEKWRRVKAVVKLDPYWTESVGYWPADDGFCSNGSMPLSPQQP